MEGYFLATGGGSEIGASSYCLSLGNNRVILDCGMRFGERKYPSIDSLFKEGIFPGSSQTGSIIVSHSHKDISELFRIFIKTVFKGSYQLRNVKIT